MRLRHTARRNAKNYVDAKTATVTRTWVVTDGTCTLRQRKSGKWTAEFVSHDDEEFAVAIASTHTRAISRLSKDIPCVTLTDQTRNLP